MVAHLERSGGRAVEGRKGYDWLLLRKGGRGEGFCLAAEVEGNKWAFWCGFGGAMSEMK